MKVLDLVRGAAKSRFLRESTVLQGASLASAAGGLVSSVALAHSIGPLEQGVFYLALSTYALFWSLANLGLAPVATMRIAQAVEANDHSALAGVIGGFLRFALWMAVVWLGLGALIWWTVPLDRLGSVFADDGSRIVSLALLLCTTLLFDGPRSLLSAALQGERRMLSMARLEIGTEACRVILVVGGARITGEAGGAIVGTVAASAAGALLAAYQYTRAASSGSSKLPSLRNALGARGPSARVPLKDCIKIGAIRNVDSLGTQTIPTILLGIFGQQLWVTYLRIAQRFGAMLRTLMGGINRTALPVLSQLAGVDDVMGLRRVYWKASLLSGLVVTLGMLVALPLLPIVLGKIYPADYGGPVFDLVTILLPGFAVASFSVANDVFYLVTGQLGMALKISALGLLFGAAVLAASVSWSGTYGPAVGISLTALWSLVHLGYAGWWFRRRSLPA